MTFPTLLLTDRANIFLKSGLLARISLSLHWSRLPAPRNSRPTAGDPGNAMAKANRRCRIPPKRGSGFLINNGPTFSSERHRLPHNNCTQMGEFVYSVDQSLSLPFAHRSPLSARSNSRIMGATNEELNLRRRSTGFTPDSNTSTQPEAV